eukprot:3349531-Lingulodinium_polyedra.AAC.1
MRDEKHRKKTNTSQLGTISTGKTQNNGQTTTQLSSGRRPSTRGACLEHVSSTLGALRACSAHAQGAWSTLARNTR